MKTSAMMVAVAAIFFRGCHEHSSRFQKMLTEKWQVTPPKLPGWHLVYIWVGGGRRGEPGSQCGCVWGAFACVSWPQHGAGIRAGAAKDTYTWRGPPSILIPRLGWGPRELGGGVKVAGSMALPIKTDTCLHLRSEGAVNSKWTLPSWPPWKTDNCLWTKQSALKIGFSIFLVLWSIFIQFD